MAVIYCLYFTDDNHESGTQGRDELLLKEEEEKKRGGGGNVFFVVF